jgi:phosphoglycerol transferase MdoB-like AlkP superfamily enzyme
MEDGSNDIRNDIRNGIKLNIRTKKSIPIYVLFLYFTVILCLYLRQDAVTKAKVVSVAGFLLILLAVTFIFVLEITEVRNFFTKYARWINAAALILTPAISFLMVETMVSNFNMAMFKAYTLYNLIWYIIIYYLIFALLRSSRLTIIVGNFLIYLLAVLNYLVYLFRGNPILPSDLLAWETGMSVAASYDVSFTREFLIATVIMISVFVLACKLNRGGKRPSAVNRLAVLCTFAIFAAVVFGWFFETDLIKSKIRVIDFFAPKYTYSSYGTAFGFVANVQAMATTSPDGYSVTKVEELLENAPKVLSGTKAEEKPNIIVIMNEAFSDLSLIGDYKTNIPYLPFIHSLEENTTKGKLYVSVFGGATSDTEYEFLTGNSMAVMPRNCVPYQQFVTGSTDSLARTLKAQGYYNIAIHPYEPSGYKRDLVYPLLGFDEFLSKKDFVNPGLIRSFISDRDSYAKIIEEYEKKEKDGPLFIFNVTMQNHGGYSADRLFSEDETVRLTEYDGYQRVEQYLSLVRESDKAFRILTDYFREQKEPTIILIFGDHQPVVYSDFHNANPDQTDVLLKKYVVPFILWANYDIPEDDAEEMSVNYLSSYLLKTAGLQGTAYNDYLLELYKEIPVINALFYLDKDRRLYGLSEDTPYYDLVSAYKYVGYNDALDKKGKLDKYFYLN